MDAHTMREIQRIGDEMPERLKKNITKGHVFDNFDAMLYERAMKMRKHENPKVRQMAEAHLKLHEVDSKKEYVNKEIGKEIEMYWEHKIQKAIREGRIKPADKNDDFMLKMQKELQ